MGAAAAEAFLRPRSVAILGASDRSRWSRTAFDNLLAGGFPGAIHLVNRNGGTVHGRPAVPSCAALDGPVDLGIVMVPGAATADALRDLGACGARSAILLTSGFAETGKEGAAVQRDLTRLARDLGLRLLGPNSLGFLNFADAARAWTTPIRAPSRREGVAVLSQSGATAHFLSNLAYQWDVGLSHVVATGNEADLGLTDFATALLPHPAVRSLALFLETVRDPAAFVALAQAALAARKALVVLKVGASEVTARAALAHTGALVGDDRVFDGLCRTYGVVRTRSVEELLATAEVAARAGPLRPGGLAIVSNSGGICEIAADAAAARGIALPEPTPAAAEILRAAIPDFATPHNPLDLTGAITPEGCGTVVATMAREPGIAAVLCPYYEAPTVEADMSDRLSALHAALAAGLNGAPVPGFVVSYTSTHLSDLSRRIVAERGMPYLACGMDRAIAALAGVMEWSGRLREPASVRREPPAPVADRPRTEHATLRLLAAAGVPVVPMTLATTEDEAVAAARALDGPAVLKVASPDIAHKSDIGGVALDLRDEAAVRDAHRRITAAASRHAPGARLDGVLVAPMRPPGVELFVGVARDPQWGAVIAFGLGGVWVEVLGDVALRLLPLDPAEAKRALLNLRGAKLLQGARGLPPADLDAVAAAVSRIGDAALALGPSLAALDVNPLLVRGDVVEALDALPVWEEQR